VPRATKTQWADARRKWEADPKQTHESIAAFLGVSHQVVGRRIASEGWVRVVSLQAIRERAQLEADAKGAKQGAKGAGKGAKTTSDDAIDIRADVLDRHRSDWSQHRRLFGLEAISKDFEAGKKAKISAEMLKIRQQGERDAYGLSADEHQHDPDGFDARVADMATQP
jgi:hypothetical protein